MIALFSAVVTTCVIVVPLDQLPNQYTPAQVLAHEKAHCAGMTSEEIIPPKRFRKLPRGMKLEITRAYSVDVKKICAAYGGKSYGCQWFEYE